MFMISYGIKAELRDEYLALVTQLRDHLTTVGNKNYTVFEVKGKKNHFTEVFTTGSVEEYDALEDNLDEKAEQLESQLEQYVDDDGMKYTTLIEAV
jgi:hypothetical protein